MTYPNDFEKDNQLIERLSSGDEQAFSEIYERYAESLIQFASCRLFSLEEARDLIHDIFVYLWIEREKINVHTNLQGFLYGIARHKIIDKIRKNATREEYANQLRALSLSLDNNLEKAIIVKDLSKIIEEAAQALPMRTKEIYYLSRKDNKSIAEISELLQISNQTVKNQLTSALKALRNTINKFTLFCLFFFFH